MTPRYATGHVFAALACTAWTLAACGQAEVTCGPGTHAVSGTCVIDHTTSCGDGTSLVDGQCLAAGGADVVAADVPEFSDTFSDTFDAGADFGGADEVATPDTATATADASADTGCVPYCVGRVCGDNGCGGTCGSCNDPAKPVCDAFLGQCKAVCVPQCTGKNCGPDGCGSTCGACAAGSTCTSNAVCLPDAWNCIEAFYADGAVCDCGCGAPDADCASGKLPLGGCAKLQTCNSQGQCVDKVPKAWTCAPSSYGALDACNCGCGVADPDCQFSSLSVVGCPGFEPVCNGNGTCAACVPKCDGKACGSDGCGGSCGTCNSPTALCNLGTCVEPCGATPLKCQTAQCGDDGCGGSCGSCADGSTCKNGTCVGTTPLEDPTSCKGHCGSTAPAGCYCTASCKATGFCCPDYTGTCECKPNCTGKGCGSDGCGGSCGSCGTAAPYCDASFQCKATCTPDCKGKSCGSDGCGGTCGDCGSGATCSKLFSCVPTAWTCDALLYGDKLGCDCGCGAQDSDCLVGDAPMFGCPATAKSCTAKGTCDVTFCPDNAACGAQWCIGRYAKGDGTWGGVCGTAISGAATPGTGCQIDEECATLACIGDKCRMYCNADSDCASSELCVAVAVPAQGLGAVAGFAAVCDFVPGSHKACKTQKECQTAGETCVALTDAKTLGPRYACAKVGNASAIGASCANFPCAPGQLCVPSKGSFVCSLPCPGGAADCPANWSCGTGVLNGAGTTNPNDDPKVPVCLPN